MKSEDLSKEKKQYPVIVEEEVASAVAKGIIDGLFMIHNKNYIHRDLKPENILIHQYTDSNGDPLKNPREAYCAKIADFGLSAEVQANIFNSENIYQVMGTILFMAPEQATGKRYGKRVDMWALGIIIFQMLTGKHPFYQHGDTEESYVTRINKGNVE